MNVNEHEWAGAIRRAGVISLRIATQSVNLYEDSQHELRLLFAFIHVH